MTGRSPFQSAAGCSFSNRSEAGFTLVEVMVCTLILVVGLVAIAGLLAVTTHMHIGAREAARSTRLAQDKIDELMKLDFDNDDCVGCPDAKVAVGGSVDSNEADHFEVSPDGQDGITIRWAVTTYPDVTPIADLRRLTVYVQNLRAQTYGREVEMSTVIRNW